MCVKLALVVVSNLITFGCPSKRLGAALHLPGQDVGLYQVAGAKYNSMLLLHTLPRSVPTFRKCRKRHILEVSIFWTAKLTPRA